MSWTGLKTADGLFALGVWNRERCWIESFPCTYIVDHDAVNMAIAFSVGSKYCCWRMFFVLISERRGNNFLANM